MDEVGAGDDVIGLAWGPADDNGRLLDGEVDINSSVTDASSACKDDSAEAMAFRSFNTRSRNFGNVRDILDYI